MVTVKALAPLITFILLFTVSWVLNPWRHTNFLGTIGYAPNGQTYSLTRQEEVLPQAQKVTLEDVQRAKQWQTANPQ